MPESRPPIELQGVSLAELQKLIDERTPAAGRPMESGALRAQRACASPATAPGTTKVRRSTGRRWSGCSRPSFAASPTAATCSSPRSRSWRSTSKRRLSAPPRCRPKARAETDASPSSSTAATRSLPDAANPIQTGRNAGRPLPRVAVRHGLEAELSRGIYYELAEIALEEGDDPPGVWSGGAFFPLAARGRRE